MVNAHNWTQAGNWASARNWLAAAAALLVAVASFGAAVAAQEPTGDLRQIELTDGMVKGLIAAQPDLAAVAKRLESMPEDAQVSVEKELNEIATKHGFTDFNQLDEVSANVQLVLDGIDPESGEYADPVKALQDELAEVKADTTLAEDEKKALVTEIEDAIGAMPPLEHPGNVALVKKYQKDIQQAMDGGEPAN